MKSKKICFDRALETLIKCFDFQIIEYNDIQFLAGIAGSNDVITRAREFE